MMLVELVKDSSRRAAMLLLAGPALLFLVPFYVIPIGRLIFSSGGSGLLHYVSDSFTLKIVFSTLTYGVLTTALCTLLGVATALGAWMAPVWLRQAILLASILPMSVSVLVMAFGWMVVGRSDGWIAEVLSWLLGEPVRVIFTVPGLIIGTANILLPYMILPVYAVLAQLDREVEAAAATLGAGPLYVVVCVTLPLAAPGIIAGAVLVFTHCVAAYAIPTLLIGDRYPLLSLDAVTSYLVLNDDARGGAAVVVMLLLAILTLAIPIAVSSGLKRLRGSA
jgi:putative spermidine/putrescine transport system permease protein